jgi:uncharacterized protein (TIGR00106 family)
MLAELRVTPIGAGPSLLSHVLDLVKVLDRSPLSYQVHPMGTTLEGSLDHILDAVRRCHEAVREKAPRVLIELSLDDREVPEGAMVRGIAHLREVAGKLPLERIGKHILER